MKFGNNDVSKIAIGNVNITKMYLGNDLVWETEPDYFWVEAVGADSFKFTGVGSALEYRIDDGDWYNYESSIEIPVVEGEKIYFRNRGSVSISGTPNLYATVDGSSVNATYNAGGNIMSLVDNTCTTTTMTCKFSNFFGANAHYILSAAQLVLPATTLVEYAYQNMFANCSLLTTAPSYIAATTFPNYACQRMFYNCSALSDPPVFNATSIGDYAFSYMFNGCSDIDVISNVTLSATTMGSNSCESMFYHCTSLERCPSLPATTLGTYCYQNMFYGCTSLIEMPILAASSVPDYAYYSMFAYCTSLESVNSIRATSVGNTGMAAMFADCTTLKELPTIYATTLGNYALRNMFYYASKIKLSTTFESVSYPNSYRIPVSGTATVGTNPLSDMFELTTGSFTGTPTIETTYYTYNTVKA